MARPTCRILIEVLISQTEMRVEVFFKQDESQWFYSVYTQEEEWVKLQLLDIQIALKDIYHKVDLESPEQEQNPEQQQ